MNNRKIVIGSNILIIFFEIIGFILAINSFSYNIFEYYTQDSNLLVLISSILYLIYIISNKKVPYFIELLKYTSVVSITVTFMVVITILSWTMEDGFVTMLFKDSMLFHHTICPILTIITFIFFEKHNFNSYKDTIRTLYFTIIYATILVILNIFKVIEGPYPFLMVYNQSVFISILWTIIILGMTLIISILLKKSNKKHQKDN